MYLFSLFSRQSGQQTYTKYRIIDAPIAPPVSRIIFIFDELSRQERCLKFWLPIEDDLYDAGKREMRIKYVLEGLKYNRRFARDVYLGIMEIKEECIIKHNLLMKGIKKGESTRDITGELLELGPLLKRPEKKKIELEEKEYALVMKRLDDRWRLDQLLSQGKLATKDGMAFLAKEIANMHKKLDRVSPNKMDCIQSISDKLAINIKCYKDSLQKAPLQEELSIRRIKMQRCERIADLLDLARNALTNLFKQRCKEGSMKRCHGDLKASNLWIRPKLFPFFGGKQQLLPLDCIDFKDEFCYIDTLSDVSMLAIDLEKLFQTKAISGQYSELTLATYFLDTYLHEMHENITDVQPVLEYYMTEKAIICAFVSTLYEEDKEFGAKQAVKYLEVALAHAHALAAQLESLGEELPTSWRITSQLDAHSA